LKSRKFGAPFGNDFHGGPMRCGRTVRNCTTGGRKKNRGIGIITRYCPSKDLRTVTGKGPKKQGRDQAGLGNRDPKSGREKKGFLRHGAWQKTQGSGEHGGDGEGGEKKYKREIKSGGKETSPTKTNDSQKKATAESQNSKNPKRVFVKKNYLFLVVKGEGRCRGEWSGVSQTPKKSIVGEIKAKRTKNGAAKFHPNKKGGWTKRAESGNITHE